MKRAIVIFVLAAFLIVSSAIWFAYAATSFNLLEFFPRIILVLIGGLAVLIGIRRIVSLKRGEPAEDELSKQIQVKTASISYYISIYLWLFIMYFCDRLNIDNHTLIGVGIAGMALIYVLSWVILRLKGLRDE
jgi:peptidoglycan/LPS O-acetylase OafA/YrhL